MYHVAIGSCTMKENLQNTIKLNNQGYLVHLFQIRGQIERNVNKVTANVRVKYNRLK